MPENILDHDDGVVDQHAHAEGQAAQGQKVQRVSGQIKGDERGDHGQRDGQGDDQGRPPVAEKKKDQADGEDSSEQRVLRRSPGYALDHFRLVHGDMELDIGREGGPDPLQLFLHGSAGDGRVGPGPLIDDEVHAFLALDPACRSGFLQRVPDVRNVADGDGNSPGRRSDGRPADVVQRLEFTESPDEDVGVSLDKASGRQIDVFRSQRRQDPVKRQSHDLKGGFIDSHKDLAFIGGPDLGGRNAVQPFQPGNDLVLDEFLQFSNRHVRRDAVEDDGHLPEVEFEDQGIGGRFRKELLVKSDLVPDVLGCEIQVRPPFEFHHDGGHPFGRHRAHFLDAIDRTHHLLQGLGQRVLDILRRGALVGRHDRNRRKFKVGKEIQAQPGKGDHPDDDQNHGHHRGRDFFGNGEFRKFHDLPSSNTTGVPSSRPKLPSTMTHSPSTRPERISTRWEFSRPSETGRLTARPFSITKT